MKSRSILPVVCTIVCLSVLHPFPAATAPDVEASGPPNNEVKIFTLEESISEALANFSSIKIKKEAIEEVINTRKKARSAFLPELSTSYGYNRFSKPPRLKNVSVGDATLPKFEAGTEDNYQWKITVKQPVFTGFALTSAYELAKLGIDVSKLELELEKLDLVLRVNYAYFSILRGDKALDVAEKAVEQLQSHVNEARDFFEAGVIPINDLLKAEVELANAQHNLTKAQNATKLARSVFNTVLKRPTNEPVEVTDIVAYEPILPDLDASFDGASKTRPEIKILDLNISRTDQQVRLVRSQYYPQIAVSADYINEGDEPDVSGSDFHVSNYWQTTVGLSWSLWQWGKTHYGEAEAESRRRQLTHARSGVVDQVYLEVKEAVLDLESAAKNIPTTKKSVQQAEENIRVSRERYHSQLTTSTEVLDAQTLLTQARLNYYNSLYDYHVAKAKLERAMGERHGSTTGCK